MPNPANPQSFNRYSYCLNNPLKYADPTGHEVEIKGWNINTIDKALQNLYYVPPEMLEYLDDVISSPSYQAYNSYRQSNGDVARVFEESQILYQANSENANVEDLYISCHIKVPHKPFTAVALPPEFPEWISTSSFFISPSRTHSIPYSNTSRSKSYHITRTDDVVICSSEKAEC